MIRVQNIRLPLDYTDGTIMKRVCRELRIPPEAIRKTELIKLSVDARKKNDCDDSDYSSRVRRSVAVMEKDERTGMSPDKVGACIAKLAMKKRSRPLKAIGFSYKAIAVGAKLLPRRFSNFIVGRIYAK